MWMKKLKKNKVKYSSLNKDIYSKGEMERYLGALNEMHGENLKAITENFVLVNLKLDSHTEMIAAMAEDVSTIKGDLKRKVDYDEFLSLVKRVRKIEAKI
jgi:hypothetical protein